MFDDFQIFIIHALATAILFHIEQYAFTIYFGFITIYCLFKIFFGN
jgi:hypothetical protein